MNIKILFMCLLQATIYCINLTIAQSPSPAQPQIFRCRDTGNFSSESLRKQRDSALDSLTSHIGVPQYTGYLHTQSSSGKPGDQVNAILLCPPVIKAEDCEKCVKKTVPYLIQNCSNKKEGVAWTMVSKFIHCMVRYADYEFKTKYEFWASGTFANSDAKANILPVDLTPAVTSFGKELEQKARRGDALRKYASGNKSYGYDTKTIYMASQCTPDLSFLDCYGCLLHVGYALQKLAKLGKVRGISVSNNCYTRYNHVPIFPSGYSSTLASSISESTWS